jgi:hypothetical protein
MKTHGGLSPFDVTDSEKIKGFLGKALLLYVCMPLIPRNRRCVVWQNEGLTYFNTGDHVMIQDFI